MFIDHDKNTGELLHAFDSVSEFLTYATEEPCDLNPRARRSRIEGKTDFYGTRTFDDALELAYKGYPRAREAGEPLRLSMLDQLSSVVFKKKPMYDFVGDTVDLPRYLSGMPDDFLIRREPNYGITEIGKTNKIVTVSINLTCVCTTTSSEILYRGASIVALIDLLEMGGKQVEVFGLIGVAPFGSWISTETSLNILIPLKQAGQPLDVDFMYFCLAHPAMLRRFGFSCFETYPEDIRYKHGIPNNNYGVVGVPKAIIASDIAFDRVVETLNFMNPITSKNWLIKTLQQQGVIGEDTNG